MENEEKLTMMKMAGYEIVDSPHNEKLRRLDVYKGHRKVDEMKYPEVCYTSALDMIFNFYLIGHFEEANKALQPGQAEQKMLAAQVYAQQQAIKNQLLQNNAYIGQANMQNAITQQYANAVQASPSTDWYDDMAAKIRGVLK